MQGQIQVRTGKGETDWSTPGKYTTPHNKPPPGDMVAEANVALQAIPETKWVKVKEEPGSPELHKGK